MEGGGRSARARRPAAMVLYAAEEFPGLKPLIKRRFKEPGDVELVRERIQTRLTRALFATRRAIRESHAASHRPACAPIRCVEDARRGDFHK
eukprot:1195505-Prorocentrum_minimum.AAC.10